MNLEKFKPWNWFRHDQNTTQGETVPVKREDYPQADHVHHPLRDLHRDFDRLFDAMNRRLGLSPLHNDAHWPRLDAFSPDINIASTDKDYTITVEAAGMDRDDITLEVKDHNLVISGTKEEESENHEQHYYHMERRYGSFQRVLALPDDADVEDISATMANGVLTIRMKRVETAGKQGRRIEIGGG